MAMDGYRALWGAGVLVALSAPVWAQESAAKEVPAEEPAAKDERTATLDAAAAAAEGEAAVVPEEPAPWRVFLKGDAELQFQAGIDRPEGEVQIFHTRLGVRLAGQPADRLRVAIDLSGEYSNYDWSDAEGLIPGQSDPFSDLYSVRLGGLMVYGLDDRWSVTGGGFGEAAGEADTDLSDAVTGGVFGGVGYAFSNNLVMTLGAGVWTRLEDDALVIPYIVVNWKIDERWQFETNGLTGRLTWAATEEIDVAFKGGAEFRQYRLDDSRPGFENGVVRDFTVPVGVEVAWRPIPALTLAVEAGAIVSQQFKFVDDGGREIREFDVDPTPYIGVRVQYVF